MASSGVDIPHTGAHSASYFDLSRSMGGSVKIVDFCIPCNPYFPTAEMFDELARDLKNILKYYPSDSATITAKLASVLGLHPQTVAMANGSTELITWIDHLMISSSVAIPIPTFGRWTDQPLETGKRVDMFPLQEREGFRLNLDEYVGFIRARGSRVAVVCNVNNPDGCYLPRRDVIRFMDALSDLDLVVVDESFIDFSDVEQYPSVGPDAVIRPNVIVLKSLGKNFGLHGIRFGYLLANPGIAGKIAKTLPKWNLNSLAMAYGAARVPGRAVPQRGADRDWPRPPVERRGSAGQPDPVSDPQGIGLLISTAGNTLEHDGVAVARAGGRCFGDTGRSVTLTAWLIAIGGSGRVPCFETRPGSRVSGAQAIDATEATHAAGTLRRPLRGRSGPGARR